MSFLLDTHVLLWAEASPELLAPAARRVLDDPAAALFLSAASAHEIAIKWRLGRLDLPLPPAQYLSTRLARARIQPLAITVEHAATVASLPDHHADPFDRVLVAQAQCEGLTLITRDAMIPRYGVAVVVA